MSRVIRCTIEMEFVEGFHFLESLSDEEALEEVKESFLDNIKQSNMDEYVQLKIVEDPS